MFDSRVDPFWAGVWGAGAGADWAGRDIAGQRISMELMKPPWWWHDTPGGALGRLAAGRGGQNRLAGLAAINLWRVISAEQLAAITGDLSWAVSRPANLGCLLDAGLIEAGRVPWSGRDKFPLLLRPARQGLDEFLATLRWRDRAGVIPARWLGSGSADRHSLLATELCLRAAEHLPDIPLVVGESGCGVADMTGDARFAQKRWRPDGVLVRRDGLRIAVEMTASATGLATKIQHWIQVLSADAGHQLVVVFVGAARSDNPGFARRLQHSLVKGLQDLHAIRAGVPGRMLCAGWTDWFPGPHEISNRFDHLVAQRLDGNLWRPVSLLDTTLVPGPTGPGALDVLGRAGSLLGIPCWLRGQLGRIDVDGWLLDCLGRPGFGIRQNDENSLAGGQGMS